MTTPETIDYQPLDAMKSAWKLALRRSLRGIYLLGWIGSFVVVTLMILSKIDLATSLLGLAPMLAVVGRMTTKIKNDIWLNFARVNGWQLDTVTSADALLPESLEFGHSRKSSPVIRADVSGVDCGVFVFDTTVGSGKNSTVYHNTVVQIVLPKVLSPLLLHSKSKLSSNHENGAFVGRKQLQLEGNFNQHFDLTIFEGQQIEALTILTPDVMQCLITYGKDVDLEIDGSNLYLYVRSDRRDPDHMRQLFRSVAAIHQQIVENILIVPVRAPLA
ncbi:MAG: DUF3137 domain-containing protein [Candidatus Saccharimonadales bacterium]